MKKKSKEEEKEIRRRVEAATTVIFFVALNDILRMFELFLNSESRKTNRINPLICHIN